MHHFKYIDGELTCEQVPLSRIADAVGSPCYVYSRATLEHHFEVFDAAFSTLPHLTAFAVKACSNLAILSLLDARGAGADIVSGGELYRAQQAGIPGERIVFSGVGKTEAEIRAGLDADILMFHVESASELALINDVAGSMGTVARIALRVNPDVDPGTHPYIATGQRHSKFGFPSAGIDAVFQAANDLPHVQVVGVHQHIGSQITEIPPFVASVDHAVRLITRLRDAGLTIDYLDIGGGVGIPQGDTHPPTPAELAAAVLPTLSRLGVTVITEPGRGIAGNAGIFLTRVLRIKDTDEKTFVVVDGAMNDLLRPSLYDAYHEVQPVRKPTSETGAPITADVVGPICESGDFLAHDRTLQRPAENDLLAIMSAGAYGFAMASNYNSRPRAPEVLVDGDQFHVIRARETFYDLVRGEVIPVYSAPASEPA